MQSIPVLATPGPAPKLKDMSTEHTHPDVAELRRNYTRAGLRRAELNTDGTRPSSRTVLLKAYDERGFVFFTNYESRKARDIGADAHVSLLFPWYPLERQVGILGRAERISATESLAYFVSRPHGSRLGAWVSQQSTVINSRKFLEMKWDEIKRKFAEGEIPLPSFWGGFRVVPSEFEFWQGRENRLHDRFRYTRAVGGWGIERLAP